MAKIEYGLSIYPFHIDAMGHVNNIVYVQWMEIGRVHLLNAVGMSVEEIAKAGFGPALVETSISYKKPLYLEDSVSGSIWISQLGSASAVMSFEFCDEKGAIAATGSQKGLFIDLTSKKPKRITSEQKEKFVAYLEADNA